MRIGLAGPDGAAGTRAVGGWTPRIAAATVSLGIMAIYLRIAPQYLGVYPPFAFGALTAGLAALCVAVATLIRPTRRLFALAAVGNVTLIAVWVLSRTRGLPLGPAAWQPVDAGLTDFVYVALEAVATLLFLGLAGSRSAARTRAPWRIALASVPTLLLVSPLVFVAAATATYGPASTSPIVAPAGTRTTLTYCRLGGTALAMDVYEPASPAARPAPAVLYVHGGGWVMGDRQPDGAGAALANSSGAFFPALRGELNRRGFVVASIDYRLAPLHPWPAPIDDASCAVRFLSRARERAGDRSAPDRRLGQQRGRATRLPDGARHSGGRLRRRAVPRPVQPGAGGRRHVRPRRPDPPRRLRILGACADRPRRGPVGRGAAPVRWTTSVRAPRRS
ncbi:MAG TPA: alpha/beta hydrolase [Thermomicrobiaceae bacterium]|nr:alpha/beta hydrolase [Thermomicrobiaceae bacterium]